MNQDKWSGDQHALFDALKELLSKHGAELPRQSVEEVFAVALDGAVSDKISDQGDVEESSSGWTGRINSGVVRPFFPDSAAAGAKSTAQSRPAVQIKAESPEMVERLLHQVMEVGAILVQVDPRPELNDLVDMSFDFPEAHLTLETQGRVVNNSSRGTAIEVSALSREDLLALEAIREDAGHRRVAQEESATAKRAPKPEIPQRNQSGTLGVNDSVLDSGSVPPVQENEDPMRSFAPLGGRHGTSRTSGRGTGRRMVQATTRRRVDLPDPDMHVARSPKRVSKTKGKSTREFYGPPPSWLEPTGDADRIEELASERALDILLQLSESGFTGLLVLETESESREQLLFDGGYVVERSSSPRMTEEELGPMLLAADKITKRQLAMAAAHADELDLTVARSLMDLNILNPEELRHTIAGRLTFLLREFCTHEQGAVHIFDTKALPAGFLPQPPLRVHVAVERTIYKRLFRKLSQQSASLREEKMKEALDAYPEIVEHERDRLERAVTREEQQRLVDRVITGRKRMREVMTESALSSADTFAVLFSLHRMGLLRFDRSLHDTVVRERLRENITVKYLSVHKASYFEVLNVHWSSYSEVVTQAYENLRQQFDPEKVPEALEADVHKKVKEINERVEAAYAALAKRKTRHAYRTRIMPEYKLEHAIPLFLKQCELAERRQHWADARDAIRRVLEINPEKESAQRKLDRFNQIIDGHLLPDPAQSNH